MNSSDKYIVIVVGGPAGCGKTTVGTQLASKFQSPFIEGDSLHSKENIDKMAHNIPLTDQDRFPWLKEVSKKSCEEALTSKNKISIVTCSMLKRQYRELIIDTYKHNFNSGQGYNIEFIFLFLYTDYESLVKRVTARKGHYMKQDMVKSQYDIMELVDPITENGIALYVENKTPDQVLQEALSKLKEKFNLNPAFQIPTASASC
ncbi:hypothetical protein PACTADRAFT_60298 [Pachysolen tannophilus NRRL Y-2460]|uniref:Gluconokinase n=1 Tax=Pachysolen tannophilus NRRL Y-2460 TaxID=669874 RepID=A0A1E4TR47_PACTA|nr:hypothetical protein PACTADRAFT_60298 [Pachysolen tannophilus NRRL Y-2460]